MALREGAVLLGALPFFHIFAAFVHFSYGLALGQTTVTLSRFEPKAFLDAIQKFKVTV